MPVRLWEPNPAQRRLLRALALDPSVARWIGPAGPDSTLLGVAHWCSRTPQAPILVGFVHLDLIEHGRTTGAFDIALHPDYRGRGLALAAVRAAETALHDRGVDSVCLGVHERNAAARRLYARAGYRETARIPAPDGAPALLLERFVGVTSRR